MADAITPITAATIRPVPPVGATREPAAGEGFGDVLRAALRDVSDTGRAAEQASQDFVTGRTSDVAATMIAVEKAHFTFSLMLQVRNRLLEAYQEIQRIQV